LIKLYKELNESMEGRIGSVFVRISPVFALVLRSGEQ